MSMNLAACDAENREICLWRTSTWVTDIILSVDEKGEFDGGSLGVLRRYKIWVRSHTQGKFDSREDRESIAQKVESHLSVLDKFTQPFRFWKE